jgi:ribosomal protein L12E/L44/L45/RPP1/RPP2
VTRARGQIRLTIALPGDEPPREFRIFTAGEVDTVKGKFLFDDAAAASVMAEYLAHGIDLMVDYDHASLGTDRAPDPAQAGKAAAWFGLEVRAGELWAVNVRWTPPATEALKRKEWRFMSPAFSTDEEGRITSLLNVAITNLPATRRLEPLMAANVTALGGPMDPSLVKKAIDALAAGDAEGALGILKDMIAAAAGAPAEEAPAEEAPAEEMAAAPEEDEEKEAVAASISRLTRITGKSTIGSAVEEVEVWRSSHLKLEAETEKLAKERATLELGKRKENAVALTKLGAETPATTGLAKGKLCKRLLDEPLDEQTERVAVLLAAKGGKMPAEVKPPVVTTAIGADGSTEFTLADGRVVSLSAREVAMCTEMKIDPKTYAGRKPAKKDDDR